VLPSGVIPLSSGAGFSKRCQYAGCSKAAAQGGTQFCVPHGGGKRCQYGHNHVRAVCGKPAVDGSSPDRCPLHGGGERCRRAFWTGWIFPTRDPMRQPPAPPQPRPAVASVAAAPQPAARSLLAVGAAEVTPTREPLLYNIAARTLEFGGQPSGFLMDAEAVDTEWLEEDPTRAAHFASAMVVFREKLVAEHAAEEAALRLQAANEEDESDSPEVRTT
jgi:hypothetical protein